MVAKEVEEVEGLIDIYGDEETLVENAGTPGRV